MGTAMAEADATNPRGFFEDRSFLDLNRRLLAAACRHDDRGHPDWGWTELGGVSAALLEPFRDEALDLVRAARARGTPWGWKDPRTTMLLDFWHAIVPNARYLLMYRVPWDVSDSIHRLGATVFDEHPDYPERIWMAYNHAVLRFHRAHSGQSLLLSIDRLVTRPERLAPLIRQHLGVPLADDPGDTFEASLFHSRGASDPLAALHAMAWPDASALLSELEAAAQLPLGVGTTVAAFSPLLAHSGDIVPQVSIITPVHNDGVYLAESIASAERSAVPNTELILVDDGSTDPFTVAFLDRLTMRGYRVERQANHGLSHARNRGIGLSRGRYILPLDADNRIRPGFLEPACAVLDATSSVGVVFGHRLEFGMRRGIVRVPEFRLSRLLAGNTIDACALFRREAWLHVGGYDESLPALEDWDFWLGIGAAGWTFHLLPAVIMEYRVRSGSLTAWMQGAISARLSARIYAKRAPLLKRDLWSGRVRSVGERTMSMLQALKHHVPVRRNQRQGIPDAPSFLIVGAQKAGTTSLFDALVSHPEILPPRTKEIHYFDLHYHQGPAWYRHQLRSEAARRSGQRTGEATPYYLLHPAVPARVSQTCPESKVIVLLRNPVERAISHHHHARRLGVEPCELDVALARESARLAGTEGLLERADWVRSHTHQQLSYVARGQYATQLERWTAHIPPERILVIQSEQLFGDPVAEVARVCDFLELSPGQAGKLQRANGATYPTAPLELRAMLQEHFLPWNRRLAALLETRWGLQIDLSLWR